MTEPLPQEGVTLGGDTGNPGRAFMLVSFSHRGGTVTDQVSPVPIVYWPLPSRSGKVRASGS